ncbi:MAG: aspartate-semialdehyde dehydrogenase [Colwellia sp.]|nr:aspartate-semialdehyde dehydrogenase [Colwellia sp.]
MLKRIAIIGASGVVGERMFQLLKERNFQHDSLELFASEKEGRFLEYEGEKFPIRPVSTADFSNIDVALFTAGTEPSVQYSQVAADAGCLVIDNTNVFRMRDDVPLIVPRVNLNSLTGIPKSNIIANPNCSTIPFARAIQQLDQQFNLKEAVVSTYQAVSGAGKAGIVELENEAKAKLDDVDYIPEVFEEKIAFNLIPRIDEDLASGATMEEQKMRQETRKILDRPSLPVFTTCVRVPVANCHSEAICLTFENEISLTKVIEVLETVPELTLHLGKGRESYPTPLEVSGSHNMHIGRVRVDKEYPNKLQFWLVADNLLIGAALNAVQIAEGMRSEGWI